MRDYSMLAATHSVSLGASRESPTCPEPNPQHFNAISRLEPWVCAVYLLGMTPAVLPLARVDVVIQLSHSRRIPATVRSER